VSAALVVHLSQDVVVLCAVALEMDGSRVVNSALDESQSRDECLVPSSAVQACELSSMDSSQIEDAPRVVPQQVQSSHSPWACPWLGYAGVRHLLSRKKNDRRVRRQCVALGRWSEQCGERSLQSVLSQLECGECRRAPR
jgi:hypothetical protein